MYKYHINVFYSEDDQCYIADVPDLQGCSAFGDTPEKAVEEIVIAMNLWIEVATEDGDEIPRPQYRPVIYQI